MCYQRGVPVEFQFGVDWMICVSADKTGGLYETFY